MTFVSFCLCDNEKKKITDKFTSKYSFPNCVSGLKFFSNLRRLINYRIMLLFDAKEWYYFINITALTTHSYVYNYVQNMPLNVYFTFELIASTGRP